MPPATDKQPAPSKKSKQFKKEEFLLEACREMRAFLDKLKSDTTTFFYDTIASANDSTEEQEDAYMAYEDLLVENLQVEINEAFDIDDGDSDESEDEESSAYTGDYTSSSEEEGDEEMEDST